MDSRPVIIFATDSNERDYLRAIVSANNLLVLCFEKENICFDNLRSIDPQAIIIKTDSISLAWRFVLALHLMETDASAILLSNELERSLFELRGLNVDVKCLPIQYDDMGLVHKLSRILCRRGKTKPIVAQKLLIGRSETIQRINTVLPQLIETTDPILISGEAGTGKEFLARLIAGSNGKQSPIVKIDCAILQSEKKSVSHIEDHLAKGLLIDVFNKIDQNDRTITILLDKIDQLGRVIQGDILFLLEKHLSRKSGEADSRIRLITTCDTDLQQLVRDNHFRKDLYYRLNVIPIQLPPLRERMEDIALLSDYFSLFYCNEMNKSFVFPKTETMEQFCSCDFSGNIDELESVLKLFVTTGDDQCFLDQAESALITKGPSELFCQTAESEAELNVFEIKNCLDVLGDVPLKIICDKFASRTEKKLMQKALEITNWNRKKAAELLNISYKSMLNKIKLYEIV